MDPNLLVSYSSNAGYFAGKTEIHNVLTKFGDQKEEMELMAPGIIGVKTKLDARKLIEDLRDSYASDPNLLSATVKWVPADFWCDANIESIVKTVKEEIKDMFLREDVYSIDINKHKSDLNEEQIVQAVTSWLRGKLGEHFVKILRIELFDKRASVTLLLPKNVFIV